MVSGRPELDLSSRWATALAEFEEALHDRGYYSAATVGALIKRVRRYAHECGHPSPWHATPGTIEGWLDGLTVGIRAVYDYRIGLRAFYGWALEAGRVPTDPTADLWGRRQELEASAAWMRALPAFVGFLRASGCSAATVKLRRYQVITLGRTVGVRDPWAVTSDDLVEWFGSRGWGRSTLKSYRAGVRTFYGWAVQVGRVSDDPSRVLPSVSEPPPMPRPAAEDEIAAALAHADARTRLLIRLQVELGLRIGEACKVSRRDLQRDASGWWLYVTGKGTKTRRLPVTDDLAAAIRAHQVDGLGFVFPGGKDGHLSTNYAGHLVSACLPPGVTPHKLRHRFATQAYAVTQDVLAVQQLLGHASPATTQRYVAVPGDNLRRLVYAVAVGGTP